jgi:hypothetical protein
MISNSVNKILNWIEMNCTATEKSPSRTNGFERPFKVWIVIRNHQRASKATGKQYEQCKFSEKEQTTHAISK